MVWIRRASAAADANRPPEEAAATEGRASARPGGCMSKTPLHGDVQKHVPPNKRVVTLGDILLLSWSPFNLFDPFNLAN